MDLQQHSISSIAGVLPLTCSSLLDLEDDLHACEGVHATTAAPLLTSEALLTGHAWPVTDGLLTLEEGWHQAGPGGSGYLKAREQAEKSELARHSWCCLEEASSQSHCNVGWDKQQLSNTTEYVLQLN